ncbi:MAG: carbon starvation protein A [bacterium]
MYTFLISVTLLIGSYFVYGKVFEKIFGIDEKAITPALKYNDGVDYVPMQWWRIYLIQFLNIAGLGPIFGAIAGAMWGPPAFLWIVFGCIFGGAMHDYFSGMLSLRQDGLSLPEIIGKYLGKNAKTFVNIFTILLLILVGTVFIMGPAKILTMVTPAYFDFTFWTVIIIIYYILATLLPIDKLIGKIYPIFGFALLFMALGISIAMIVEGIKIPEVTWANLTNMHTNSKDFPIFPMLFVTVACGAISGFHATQSPLMARCITNEKYGRRVFMGAMLSEGIVALIWAAIAMGFFGGVKELNDTMIAQKGNAAWIVNIISNTLLGKVGGVLALLGVVACPITTGDTAFRGARLTIADYFNIDQKKLTTRVLTALPLFAISILLTQINFDIIWRYMAWSNQTLSVVTLLTITVYLYQEKKNYWISLIPTIFMAAVSINYILMAPEGFRLNLATSFTIFCGFLISAIVYYFYKTKKSAANR